MKMTETTTSPTVAAPVETPKKGKGKKVATKSKSKAATHPPTSQMVTEAITALDEKKGSSLFAIKKYISANYKLDATKANMLIVKYLRSSVLAGKLVNTKGTGANGSFKFPGKDKPAPKKRSPKKAKKVAVKETSAPAKKVTPKKKPVPKKAVKAKSPAKPKVKKLKVTTTAKPKKAPAKKPATKSGKKKATPKKK